jgi:hypothetical protein
MVAVHPEPRLCITLLSRHFFRWMQHKNKLPGQVSFEWHEAHRPHLPCFQHTGARRSCGRGLAGGRPAAPSASTSPAGWGWKLTTTAHRHINFLFYGRIHAYYWGAEILGLDFEPNQTTCALRQNLQLSPVPVYIRMNSFSKRYRPPCGFNFHESIFHCNELRDGLTSHWILI